MQSDLLALVDRFDQARVLLVGDLMLDRYLFGDAERISPEAPVPVLRIVERQDRVGGAGSVALNIAALGARCICCGLVGDDAEGRLVVSLLAEAGVDVDHIRVARDRPTITKTRLVGLAEHRHRQQILRVDEERVSPPSAEDAEALIAAAERILPNVDVACLEDYSKGVLADEICEALIAKARRHERPVLVDPCRAPQWGKYSGATLLTPNRAELEIGLGRQVSDGELREAAAGLADRLQVGGMLVTLGRDGALLARPDGSAQRFATTPRAVYDNTGAGDAVLAAVAVTVGAGGTLEHAGPIANIAGGLEVSKFGCVPITRDEVRDELLRGTGQQSKVRQAGELAAELQARRGRGETVVFTNGCFDILHPGHVALLEQAKRFGSILVVGVNSDGSVREQGKGDDRPIRTERDRARMLAALEAVDYVVVFDDADPGALIERVRPDVLVKGSDWDGAVVGQSFVESNGGRVELIKLIDGYSTTGELDRIRRAASADAS